MLGIIDWTAESSLCSSCANGSATASSENNRIRPSSFKIPSRFMHSSYNEKATCEQKEWWYISVVPANTRCLHRRKRFVGCKPHPVCTPHTGKRVESPFIERSSGTHARYANKVSVVMALTLFFFIRYSYLRNPIDSTSPNVSTTYYVTWWLDQMYAIY